MDRRQFIKSLALVTLMPGAVAELIVKTKAPYSSFAATLKSEMLTREQIRQHFEAAMAEAIKKEFAKIEDEIINGTGSAEPVGIIRATKKGAAAWEKIYITANI